MTIGAAATALVVLTLSASSSASPASLSADASIAEAVKAMNSSGVRHLPLINDDGEVAGLISADHIVRYLVEHFPTEVYNLPPRLKQMITSAEGA